MAKLKALRNLTLSDGEGHREVKKGEVFECSDSYAEEHLHHDGYVEEAEAGEEVTADVKAKAVKEKRLTKAEQKAADKAAKAAAKAEKDEK